MKFSKLFWKMFKRKNHRAHREHTICVMMMTVVVAAAAAVQGGWLAGAATASRRG